jgi:nicotinate-nucleotide adenylyltransferase
MKNKIILFGGSFNPVHIGHIAVAEFALEHLNASQVIFIPAKRSPFKTHPPQVTDQQRTEMLRLAISDRKEFSIDTCELSRPAPSYTLDTVLYFKEKFPQDTILYWLIGADMVGDLSKWYQIQQIMDNCIISVMNRGGIDRPDFEQFEKDMPAEYASAIRKNMINTPRIDISSTDVRWRIEHSEDVSALLDSRVLNYIRTNRLYVNRF